MVLQELDRPLLGVSFEHGNEHPRVCPLFIDLFPKWHLIGEVQVCARKDKTGSNGQREFNFVALAGFCLFFQIYKIATGQTFLLIVGGFEGVQGLGNAID